MQFCKSRNIGAGHSLRLLLGADAYRRGDALRNASRCVRVGLNVLDGSVDRCTLSYDMVA